MFTNVDSIGDTILWRGIKDGVRTKERIEYSPTLYLQTKNESKFRGLHGEYLQPIKPGTMRDATQFVKQYDEVENFKIYGMDRWVYAFIADHYPGDIDWSPDAIRVAILDIETDSRDGFPDVESANHAIVAISVRIRDDRIYSFGLKEYHTVPDHVTYKQCDSEIELLAQFLRFWAADHPDIASGWNSNEFDIPYLVNRITKILGEKNAKKLSPWGMVRERRFVMMGKEIQTYRIIGVATIDYLDLYKKFSGRRLDSYKLDHVSEVELGEKKRDWRALGYSYLWEFYDADHSGFMDYNVWDVDLVSMLDDKLQLLGLMMTLAYMTKVNYEDVFSQGRMWDSLIYNHLLEQDIIVPPRAPGDKSAKYEGALVKEPVPGFYDWVASFDLTSLYPSLIIQYNISPETLVEPDTYSETMRRIVSQHITLPALVDETIDLSGLAEINCTMPASGFLFRKDKEGFLPQLVRKMLDGRKIYKKKMLDTRKEIEKQKASGDRDTKPLEALATKYRNYEQALKVTANSVYGSLGNEFFRFFDIRLAESITLSGQLTSHWIQRALNRFLNKVVGTEDHDFIIASDTDSAYVSLAPLIARVCPNKSVRDTIRFMDKACEKSIQPFIDSSYQRLAAYTNAYEQRMVMKREALADKALWTAKKRYIINVYNNEGVEYATPNMKVIGLESVKSSTPLICREKMVEAFHIIMEKTEADVQAFIKEFKKEFVALPYDVVAFPSGINGIDKYSANLQFNPKDPFAKRLHPYIKRTPIHVKGALIFNHLLKVYGLTKQYHSIQNGDKIKYLYLKTPNEYTAEVISYLDTIPKEFNIEPFIDYDMLYQKTFVDPVQIVLTAVGWQSETVDTLDAFFN